MFEPEFWVAVAFFIFVAFLGYIGAHRMILAALDGRRDRIKAELDEARRLREEAQKLLADYQRKQREVEGEAETIISEAQALADVRAAAADAAIAAAEKILRETAKGEVADELIAKGIAEVKARLH